MCSVIAFFINPAWEIALKQLYLLSPAELCGASGKWSNSRICSHGLHKQNNLKNENSVEQIVKYFSKIFHIRIEEPNLAQMFPGGFDGFFFKEKQ